MALRSLLAGSLVKRVAASLSSSQQVREMGLGAAQAAPSRLPHTSSAATAAVAASSRQSPPLRACLPLSPLPQAAGSTLLEALRQQQVQQQVGGSALPAALMLLRHFMAAATHPAQASAAAGAAAEPAADAAGSEALMGLEQLLLPAIPLEQQEQQGQYRDLIVPVFDLQRQPVGSYTLGGDIFDVPIRKDILHRVVRWQLAKQQQGTHKTKTRSEVRGGGRKPRPQKGSGRSRQGTIRAPQW
jgi:hypothetical protein